MSERFSLKWNDFHSNVSKSFGLLREEEYLHDVTLVSDDNKQMSAHKLVLSACSQYFKGIFKNNKRQPNTFLCLTGLDHEDLKNILDYMYNGEVHIFQENLDRFLEVAQKLRLEGLMENKSNNTEHVNETAQSTQSSFIQTNYKSIKEETFAETEGVNNSINQHASEFIEKSQEKGVLATVEKVASVSTDIQELENQINQYLEKGQDGLYRCTLCGKTGKLSRNVKTHIEIHIEGLEFPCDKCKKIFRSRNSLNFHNHTNHK